MKNIKILLFLLLISNIGISQKVPCSIDTYNKLKHTANQLARQGQYKEAIAKYTSAKTCRPDKSLEIDNEIAKVFDLVNEERIKAIENERLANIEKERAIEAEKATNLARDSIEQEKISVENQRDKAIRARKLSTSNNYSNTANLILNTNNHDALLLAKTAWDSSYTPGASNALGRAYYKMFDTSNRYLLVADLENDFSSDDFVLSPNGEYILTFSSVSDTISMSYRGELRNLKGNLIARLDGDKFARRSVSIFVTGQFSPNGKNILTCSVDGVKLWDLQGNLLSRIDFYFLAGSGVPAVFSPDGKYILVTSFNKVFLYDLKGHLLTNFAAILGLAKKIYDFTLKQGYQSVFS